MNVGEITIPEQKVIEGQPFPAVLSPQGSPSRQAAVAWLRDNGDAIRQRALEAGAVLLRGFPLSCPEDFDAAITAAGFKGMPYVGGAAPRREVVASRVLTTNESPPEEPIPFHHEMSQVPNPPAYIFFYCDVPPETGGETPIVLSNRVYQRFYDINPGFADRMEAQGARYVRVMPAQDDDSSPIGRSWRATFQADAREQAEGVMREAGMQWEWLDSGDLWTITRALPAIRTDPRSQKKTFFNSVVAAYTGWTDQRNDPKKAVRLGDDSPVDGDALSATADAMQQECVAFRWQKGDLLVIDNALVMHSRRPFTGPRRILASIASG
jgi:alpha-ketoglutarate-dependent taurine dioxygenase